MCCFNCCFAVHVVVVDDDDATFGVAVAAVSVVVYIEQKIIANSTLKKNSYLQNDTVLLLGNCTT